MVRQSPPAAGEAHPVRLVAGADAPDHQIALSHRPHLPDPRAVKTELEPSVQLVDLERPELSDARRSESPLMSMQL